MVELKDHITVCNNCYTPHQTNNAFCVNCKLPNKVDFQINMNLEDYLVLERAPCPRCEAPKIIKASFCFACKNR